MKSKAIENYKRAEYIETESGNKISRSAVIGGSQFIVLGGTSIIYPKSTLRGDLTRSSVSLSFGKYTIIRRDVVIRPPCKMYKQVLSYYPMKFGEYVFIGDRSIIESVLIGSRVYIGKDCVINAFVIIRDCCYIEDNTLIPSNTCIPPYSRVRTNEDGKLEITQLPESSMFFLQQDIQSYYDNFIPSLS
ncbi:hypothetical protein MP638_004139 [Amoeboaphelidium occidentale]|nr:hypothetical protein MP638_004139 [Amoeboaphelidium occidentale]